MTPCYDTFENTAPSTYRRRGERWLVAALALIPWTLAASDAWARSGEPPVSFRKSSIPLAAVERQELPRVDVESLRDEDAATDRSERPGPVRFAASIPAAFGLDSAGTWEALPEGGRIWRLRVTSPGALSLNVRFDAFDLPEGAGLWLYDPLGQHIQGPFTARDQTPDGGLWTPVVLGDEIVLEVHLPAAATATVELGAVHHGYRFFGELPRKQGACNIDIICPEADPYRDQGRAVARYTQSGIFLCTGQLVNNTLFDFRPLFLTAEHCGVDDNPDSIVVYWNFESPTCGLLNGGSLDDNQMGSTLVARHQETDMTLLELDESPLPESNVYFAGWDAKGAVPQRVVAIHHPRGDEKAIAFEEDPLVSVNVVGYGTEENHWQVTAWNQGTTEGGSSGSCIFDQVTGLCLGTLTGGTASCSNTEGFDVFAKVSEQWEGGGTPNSRLADWLDPAGGGTTLMLQGSDPSADGCRRDATTVCLQGNRFEVRVDWTAPPEFPGTRPALSSDRGTADSALFYYFDPQNLEFLVKVVDGCAINGQYWVFCAAATHVGFSVIVTDTVTGEMKSYENAPGELRVADIAAFGGCP